MLSAHAKLLTSGDAVGGFMETIHKCVWRAASGVVRCGTAVFWISKLKQCTPKECKNINDAYIGGRLDCCAQEASLMHGLALLSSNNIGRKSMDFLLKNGVIDEQEKYVSQERPPWSLDMGGGKRRLSKVEMEEYGSTMVMLFTREGAMAKGNNAASQFYCSSGTLCQVRAMWELTLWDVIKSFKPDADLALSGHPSLEDLYNRVLTLKEGDPGFDVEMEKDVPVWVDGSRVWHSATFSSEGGCILVVENDVSRARNAEDALAEMKRSKEALVQTVSDELRPPLQGILSLCDTLLADPSLSEANLKTLKIIRASGGRLSVLVNDIRDVTSMEHATFCMKDGSLSMYSVAQNVCETLQPLVREDAVTLVNAIDPGTPLVQGDQDRVFQILINLVGNSLANTPFGDIRIGADVEGSDLEVFVEDPGVGIPEHKLATLFDPHPRARRRSLVGTGLGLSFVKKLVEAHGGVIWVTSSTNESDHGTTITFTIPLSLIDCGSKKGGVELGFLPLSRISSVSSSQSDQSSTKFRPRSLDGGSKGKNSFDRTTPTSARILPRVDSIDYEASASIDAGKLGAYSMRTIGADDEAARSNRSFHSMASFESPSIVSETREACAMEHRDSMERKDMHSEESDAKGVSYDSLDHRSASCDSGDMRTATPRDILKSRATSASPTERATNPDMVAANPICSSEDIPEGDESVLSPSMTFQKDNHHHHHHHHHHQQSLDSPHGMYQLSQGHSGDSSDSRTYTQWSACDASTSREDSEAWRSIDSRDETRGQYQPKPSDSFESNFNSAVRHANHGGKPGILGQGRINVRASPPCIPHSSSQNTIPLETLASSQKIAVPIHGSLLAHHVSPSINSLPRAKVGTSPNSSADSSTVIGCEAVVDILELVVDVLCDDFVGISSLSNRTCLSVTHLPHTGSGRWSSAAMSSHSISQRTQSNDSQITAQGMWGPMSSSHKFVNHSDLFGHHEVISIDHNAVNHVVIEQLLCSVGYQVTVCSNGHDAIELFQNRGYIADLMLMDGHILSDAMDAVRVLRRLYPTSALPLIMLSDDADEDRVVEGLASGCNDYIRKPFGRQELLARIQTALRLSQMWRTEAQAASQRALLMRMLPVHVIERLQSGQTKICDTHDEVTILFSDIVGFTSLAAAIPTEELVGILNRMFSGFDEMCDRHQVYKVETIGDAYMVVAGHDDRPSNHAQRIASMALSMQQVTEGIERPGGGKIQIRIGIHTGPAFSGVVGVKMPRYCFFGDTVNTASRMESTGVPGEICVSEPTKMLLPEDRFEFQDRGEIEVKGKGKMLSFILKGKPDILSPSAIKVQSADPLVLIGRMPSLAEHVDSPSVSMDNL